MSFRAMTEVDQMAEVRRLNKGAEKGLKGVIKTNEAARRKLQASCYGKNAIVPERKSFATTIHVARSTLINKCC
jgi:hypothetical protein